MKSIQKQTLATQNEYVLNQEEVSDWPSPNAGV